MNLNDMTVAQLKEHADTIGVTYPSKVKKAILVDMIETREEEITSLKLRQDGWDRPGGSNTPMPLGYRGRAMGANDYPKRVRTSFVHAPAPLGLNERVTNYLRQNGKPTAGFVTFTVTPTLLTDRQFRRTMKKFRKF